MPSARLRSEETSRAASSGLACRATESSDGLSCLATTTRHGSGSSIGAASKPCSCIQPSVCLAVHSGFAHCRSVSASSVTLREFSAICNKIRNCAFDEEDQIGFTCLYLSQIRVTTSHVRCVASVYKLICHNSIN